MIEVSYRKSKIISKTTVNLGLTGNREIMGDRFQIILKDLSDKVLVNPNMQIYDDHDILVKAYSINNRTEGHGGEENDAEAERNQQRQLVGSQRINPAQFRQLQNTEHNLQVAIPVPGAFVQFDQGGADEEQAEEEDGEVDDFSNMADSLLNKMNQDLESMQETRGDKRRAAERYILVQLTAFATETRVTRNPLGILSLGEVRLYNLDKHIKDLKLDRHILSLEIEANGNHLRSENAITLEDWRKKSRDKTDLGHREADEESKPHEYSLSMSQPANEGEPGGNGGSSGNKLEPTHCLWPSDGNPSTFFKEGRAYSLGENVDSQGGEGAVGNRNEISPEQLNGYAWEQPAMFSVFTSSAADQVSIALVLESHAAVDNGEGSVVR